MKYGFCLLLLLAANAWAASVGDTYQQVLAEKGTPKSQVTAGARRILNYPDQTIELRDDVVTAIKPVAAAPAPADPAPAPAPAPAPVAPPSTATTGQAAVLKQEIAKAVARVQGIVNQPVTAYNRTPDMHVAEFGAVWFHPGALKPDFNKVDVRQSQQKDYDKYEYVSSDLNPGVAFIGHDLEFNPMTKLFYTNRSLPKKKLTEDEMIEIDQLYRIIGRCEQQLSALPPP